MANITEVMKKFIEDIVKMMVDKKEEVEITVSSTTKSILIQIKVSKPDIGKVIGRKGRSIEALKILSTVVKNTQFLGDTKDVFIEIIEDEKSNFFKEKVLNKQI